ncbi:hypothetical protein MVLG_04790 [Microbotryum lychnidis-dioicae p1A1 Lamole]|uniref:Glutathione S-transferase n=2 Tax=Microbotryum TaxID=34416 RepID=U5HCA3_USTV1|nr:hypothetical protein MVLG_04790 [Microbotryum lychnidis-dioicae p1A1 Lamole]SGY77096.1 BQ5605_C005g03555 [Microbotryum silenes-dioicae]|eukprot:KDE04826.1 hypothetical protein MVLG_04790 [Microbotryum lychnidis-dioicae p1A1 Lamole]
MPAQFTLYSHTGGPNGWTVAFLLKALGLSYETKYLDFSKGEQKASNFVKLNPNGRIPALVDHQNGDFVVWESKAILLYLVDTYDKEGKFTVSDPKEKAQLNQLLFFQASGQGPYYGQAAHFFLFAPQKIPYAIKRYKDEVKRVLGVQEELLKEAKGGYLVGGKVTIADLAFITWNEFAIAASLGPDGTDVSKEFPTLFKWHEGLKQLSYVAETYAEKAKVGAH